jgi:DNA mismatch repair protein MutL
VPRVAVLPSAVADQIAAGEVVERPASVVKELVENALDAGATAVDLTVEEGGRALVRVSDDGGGMDRDDAVLALSRHATSKIRQAEDLVGVASFGFRGEALPAICSVAHLELVTAPADGAGTRVEAAGGALVRVDEAARRRGTTVSVARLFYNTPARQKFLRSARSEWRAIADVLVLVALSRPDVRITATHDGRPTTTYPAAPSLRARIGSVYGAGYADGLLEVDDVDGPVRVAGLVERPGDVGTAARRAFLAVNGRAVREPGLVRAAEAAYRSTIPAGLRPSLFLTVVVPSEQVDVNVHPAKAEVRFRDRWSVERAVERAVRRALGTFESGAELGGGWRRYSSVPHAGVAATRPRTGGTPRRISRRSARRAVRPRGCSPGGAQGGVALRCAGARFDAGWRCGRCPGRQRPAVERMPRRRRPPPGTRVASMRSSSRRWCSCDAPISCSSATRESCSSTSTRRTSGCSTSGSSARCTAGRARRSGCSFRSPCT